MRARDKNIRPITRANADGAAPGPKRYLVFDGSVHGFAFKVEPSGAKAWIVQKSSGVVAPFALGAYPDLTVEQATRCTGNRRRPRERA